MALYANEYAEIPAAFSENAELRLTALALIRDQPILGKVMEGSRRLAKFRAILTDLVAGPLSLPVTYRRTELELPPSGSPYSGDGLVFALGWARRLVDTQYSRFYNQAVMQMLMTEGHTRCFVPHSAAEQPTSLCSRLLAGNKHDLASLYLRLVHVFENGIEDLRPGIPDHPLCSHVVRPID